MSFPRYPRYKDSGVEWLGEVPEHWELDRLKRSTIHTKNGVWGAEPQGDLYDIPCIRVADFDRKALRMKQGALTIRNVVDTERGGRVLTRGDLLLEKSGGGELQPVGCVILYDGPVPAVCSNFVARVQLAPAMEPSFWCYAHAAMYALGLTTRSIKQTSGIQNLDQQQYLDELMVFPSWNEQRRIATFLDRETARLDGLLAEQQHLIELLKEKRHAVISHAVTHGLNPDAPMKPSGVEWLGEVPADWEVVVLKRVAAIRYGIGEPPAYHNIGTPLIRATNVHAGQLSFDGLVFVDPSEIPERRIVWLAPGDIIVVRSGAYTGDSAIIPDSLGSAIAGFDMVLRCVDVNPMFVQYALLSSYLKEGQVDLERMRAAQPHLNAEELGSCFVLLPTHSEQAQIVRYLDAETTKLDMLTAEVERAIALLQERRAALISAAVTGKIDVRGLAEAA